MKTIVVLFDYSLPEYLYSNQLENIKQRFSNHHFITLNWNDILANKITDFKAIINHFETQLSELLNPEDEVLFVGNGFAATILNLISYEYKNSQSLFFNIILSRNYINPYTSNKPTYYTTKPVYYKRINKELLNRNNLFPAEESEEYNQLYSWYSNNLETIEEIIKQVSLYDNLVYLKKHEFPNSNLQKTFVFKNKDNIVDYKDSLNYLKKVIKTNPNYNLVIDESEWLHWLIIEQPEEFIKILSSTLEHKNGL